MRRYQRLALACAMSACGSALAAGSQAGSVDGRIDNSLGQPLANITVTVETGDGKKIATTRTDQQGAFHFDGLNPGQYAILATGKGYRPGLDIVAIDAHQAIHRQIVLASKAALEMTVTAQKITSPSRSSVPATAAGSTSYHISSQAINDMPEGADTPFNQILLQAPGVVQDSFGQLHVRGDHADLQYRINGILLPEAISGFGQTLDSRFISNLNLLTGALPAEYGYRTAGVVDIHTQTGDVTPGGNVSLTVGNNQTSELNASRMGHSGNFSYYVEASSLQNSLGIENPMPTRDPLHDSTTQNKGFAWLSWALNDHMRLTAMAGVSNGRFQIPDLYGQSPQFALQGISNYPSSVINEQQEETTSYGMLALQGTVGAAIDYQIALFSRYSRVNYAPDVPGDLIYTGVAATALRDDTENGIQTDVDWRLNARHTLRTGFLMSYEMVGSSSNMLTFPANSLGVQTSAVPEAINYSDSQPIWLYGLYGEDSWKLTQNLTFDYGVRYDIYQGWINGNQFGPRAGLRWQITPATVAHVGYAHYFTPPPSELITNQQVGSVVGTTNAPPGGTLNDPVRTETSDYWDIGIDHQFGEHWSAGLDGYYKYVHNLLDEGQFGSALIFTPFNYQLGEVYGVELTSSYHDGNLNGYFNLSNGVALGKNIVSAQYNFAPAELNYIANNWVHLDHDQTWTASGGVSRHWHDANWSLDMIYGSGLRSGFANTAHLPAYMQFNTSVGRDFMVNDLGRINLRLAVINLLGTTYEIRDGTGIGVGAPQYGPPRTFLLTASKTF